MTHTAKHTPGPWAVRRHEDSDTKDIRGASGEEIALCYAGDAALIAAAPAMYEALKGALVNMNRLGDKRSAYRAMWISQVEATLAQAEGKAL